MPIGKIKKTAAFAACALLVLAAAGCGLFRSKPPPEPIGSFAAPLTHPVSIEVVDERPSEETVADPTYASGFAYTTYGAEDQARAFVATLGTELKRAKAITAFRNVNASEAPDPAGLQFSLTLRHWYAKWPLLNTQYPVLIEGDLVVELRIAKAGQVIYEQSYDTTGKPEYADLSTMKEGDYAKFIPHTLELKLDQVLVYGVRQIGKDLSANWETVSAADRG